MRKILEEIPVGEPVIEEFFAFLPITIDGERRWLERVKVERIYKYTLSLDPYYINIRFVN